MESLSLWHAAVLGIVEGVSEFLPISSTGHLILTSRLLGIVQSDFMKMFEIVIQLGAIASVVVLYRERLFTSRASFARIALAFLPTAVVGFALYAFIKRFLLGEERIVLFFLFFVGLLLIFFELFHKEKEDAVREIESISYKDAFRIGLFQSLAVVPGVSRSGATILGGMLLGISRKTIVEFSFLLAVPTMCAAAGLDMLKNYEVLSSANIPFLAVGFFVSFAVALLSIRFLLKFIEKHTFVLFGVYRMALAVLFWLFVL